MAACFLPLQRQMGTGVRIDLSGNPYPAHIGLLSGQSSHTVPPPRASHSCTTYGFVASGPVQIESDSGRFDLPSGFYFSAPGELTLSGLHSESFCLFITQFDDHAFFHIGGPVEDQGRLRYIDGCTDSLLIAPVILGAPCLNLLHIPAHTRQSRHTHPSFRAGLIVRGHGICSTPGGDHPLEPGLPFLIPENALHSFHTAEEDLLVIAYHPDSDFGPTHEVHPMLNRTYLAPASSSSSSSGPSGAQTATVHPARS